MFSPFSPTSSIDTPTTAISESIEISKTVAVFYPYAADMPSSSILGDWVNLYSLPNYKLEGFSVLKPRYFPKPCVIPKSDSEIRGRLLFVPEAKLKTLDSWEDATHTKTRVECSVSSAKPNDLIQAYVYLWNGNCVAGEYEYL
ncbi:hypothetical protein V1512DRAFT_266100 [Lipomyces arxii]|uniref:uncharacterized protein n=1 Tax=Lipomyces arxii TaxID=56418 RepID=UPI0034CEFFE3